MIRRFYMHSIKNNIDLINLVRKSVSNIPLETARFSFFHQSIPTDYLSAHFPGRDFIFEYAFEIDSRFAEFDHESDYYEASFFYVTDLMELKPVLVSKKIRVLQHQPEPLPA